MSPNSPVLPPSLHLVLPGLLWPSQAMQDMVFDLKLPALSWLLGKSRLNFAPVAGSQHWLANIVGLPALPFAALRASAQGLEQTGRWLCLDPINLRIERTQLVVEDPAILKLTDEEAAALTRDLAPLLAELGELHIASPHEWQLHLHETSNISTTPLADAIGLNGEQLMPKGDNVKIWRRLLNEVQMELHEHPVNTARSARGLPAVNSLWPWGEGQFDTHSKPIWHTIQANGALWQGLARQMDAHWQALPPSYSYAEGKTLVVQTALETATKQRDAIRWRAALMDLEQHWFAPLMQALQTGKLKELTLHGYGEGQAMTSTINSTMRLYFWRKPAALTVLGINEEAASGAIR